MINPSYYYQPPPNQDEEMVESYQQRWLTWESFLSMMLFLLCVFFSCMVIYCLVTYNTDAVRTACKDLVPFMVTRTVLGFCLFFALTAYSLCFVQNSENRSMMVGFFFIYFLVLSIWGGVVVSKNMISNKECTDALYDKTFQVPLLGDLGWVYVICDVFYAVCTVLLFLNTQYQQPQDEMMQPNTQ
jgi:hypothetical protein